MPSPAQPDQPVSNANTSQQQLTASPYLEALFSQQLPEATAFVNTIIRESVDLSASDIFIEPTKTTLRVRVRVDGVLYELGQVSLQALEQISSRIKVLSTLDPTEKRKIQEGQFTIDHQGRLINLRVEIAQTVYGELIVIRIHEKQTIVMDLAQLGFNDQAYQTYSQILKQRSGLILVCGPTGCGKTTTLYSTISHLNQTQQYNIMTIEDPVEYQMDGVNQMQVQTDIGFTFTSGLRTILRLSPDIVLVGEIRDRETAQIAIESGLTGQMVLSTIHADDAVGTLLRLLDLDIETYFLNSALLGIVGQRLVRKICTNCPAPYPPSPQEIDLFEKIIHRTPQKLTRGQGCAECRGLGYWSRIGIYEILQMDTVTRDLIRKQASEQELRQTLVDNGFQTLLQAGLLLCEQKVTTVEEILRHTLRNN